MDNRKFSDQEIFRRQKLKDLQKNPYSIQEITDLIPIYDVLDKYGQHSKEELKDTPVHLKCCGRVMFLREPFFVVSEEHNKLQCYLNIKGSSDELVKYFQNSLDIGDIVEVYGELFVTMKNELTLKIHKLQIVAKCLKPLPEKTTGIKDPELLVRERVAALITDKDLFLSLKHRSEILFILRTYLNSLNYMEVETPMLHKTLGGAIAKPFITHYNSLNENFYLRIAPELALKKLIASGYNKVFEIGKSFRNEGIDHTHNPEFTSIEIYTSYFGMNHTMKLTENIIQHIAKSINKTKINDHVDLMLPFKKSRLSDLVKEKTGVDFYNTKVSLDSSIKLCDQHKIDLLPHEKTIGHILHKLFEKLVEESLIEPTFVYGYHKDVSPLAKQDPNNEEFTNRFELFIGGRELANGFSELNDPIDQLKRFQKQLEEKNIGNDEVGDIDYDYIKDIEYGFPPTGGLGIGIDRLIMLFTEKSSIKNVIFFPQIRSQS